MEMISGGVVKGVCINQRMGGIQYEFLYGVWCRGWRCTYSVNVKVFYEI